VRTIAVAGVAVSPGASRREVQSAPGPTLKSAGWRGSHSKVKLIAELAERCDDDVSVNTIIPDMAITPTLA